MAQSLETPPKPVTAESATSGGWERDDKAWNVPRQTLVATTADSEVELDWERFAATYFPVAGRHNLEAIRAYSDYKRSFRPGKQSASGPDAEAPSIEEWENEGGAPSMARSRH
jgi:hypothetical protein